MIAPTKYFIFSNRITGSNFAARLITSQLGCILQRNQSISTLRHEHSFLSREGGVSDLNRLQRNVLPTLTNHYSSLLVACKRHESTKIVGDKNDAAPTQAARLEESTKVKVITQASKLKKAVAEYGSTVIVFHITISLISLGIFYVLVSNGLDVAAFLTRLGINDEAVNKLASNAGTFVLAYAVHKVFAPLRIGITLTLTPFIVRYFRRIGWLKK